MPRKRKSSFLIVTTAIIILFLAIILFSRDPQTLLIEGLLKIGLFQPDIDKNVSREQNDFNYSSVRFKDGTGKVVALSDYKGKVVFINFWATWCSICKGEMPSIENLYLKNKDNKIAFLMVDVDNKYKDSRKYMDDKNFTLPLFTPDSLISEELFGGPLPTTVVFNKEGQLVFKHEGLANFNTGSFKTYLNELKSN